MSDSVLKKVPEITWSLMHPTPLDAEYVKYLLEKAKVYPVDSFEICGLCHSPYGGLDGLIDYHEYASAFAQWDQEMVADNQQKLNEILALSHAAGKAVYLWHREVMIPPGLLEDLPELLDENGEFDLLGRAFSDLIRFKIDRALAGCPELDGVVLSLTEADFSAIHNSNTEKYPPVEVVRYIIGIFASELEKRNKRFIMRSFGSIAQDYEDILAGAEKLAGEHHFEIETKITPYDFDPFLPVNPFLRKSANFTLSAECDCIGEFMGQGYMPLEHVHHIVRYVREAQEAGVDRFVIRMDRRGNCIFDLYELNYFAYDKAIHDPSATAGSIREEWYEAHYPASIRKELIELDRLGWEMVTKTYFLDEHVLFHGNYCMKYLKSAFVFSLFHNALSLENGRGVWSILTHKKAPGKCRIFEEKQEAISCADKGYAICQSLHLPEGDYRNRLWSNARVITRAVNELILCMIAYFDDMELERKGFPVLKAQTASSLKALESLAGHELKLQTQEVFNGLEHRMNEYRRSVEELYLERLGGICRELLSEYEAEYAVKEQFISGSVDGIACGGIYDDIRIYRYMHASHCQIHNSYAARWAGNRVFPNGFIRMKLKRSELLVIHGDSEENGEFVLSCDGIRQKVSFDAEGCFWMELDPSKGEFVTVQLEKAGKSYPRFYAVCTFLKSGPLKKEPMFQPCTGLMDRSRVPEVIYEEDPKWCELYYTAWQSAYNHIFTCPGSPVKTYMNEGVRINKIWIWDSCFMVLFCRYAADYFPGIQTLENFYRIIHDEQESTVRVHIPDNPPLFAWTEYEYLLHTGDLERIRRLLLQECYLQKHFAFIENMKSSVLYPYADSPTGAEFTPGKGFRWHSGKAGMDNSPRGDDDARSIYYLDLSVQQGLSALYIARLAEAIQEKALAEEYYKRYEEIRDFVNERFYSEEDRMYYDRKIDESGFCKVLTPASLWPLLAEMTAPEQTQALVEAISDESRLGGERPLPSLSRSDPRFDKEGGYWRGGIWMPMVYMCVKGLERNGQRPLADRIARKMISLQVRTYEKVEPHTIWECYSPTEDKPSTNKVGKYAREDFCGWSALGPISLFIENILGIRSVNALENRIEWTPSSAKKNGIRNLKMGGACFTLIADPVSGTAYVHAEKDFTLHLYDKDVIVKKGSHTISLNQGEEL